MKTIVCRDREEWLRTRRTVGIGASEAAVILGISRFLSPFALYHQKLGLEPSQDETEAQRWGQVLEDAIAARFAEETGREIIKPEPFTISVSEQHPFMLATLDRLQRAPHLSPNPIPLELKNVHWSLEGNWREEPPLEYHVQLQHQLAVTGDPFGSLAALVGGQIFLWVDIARNDDFIAVLIEKEREFWQRCLNHDAPAVDAHKTTSDTLKRLFQAETGEIVVLPPAAVEWDDQLEAIKERKALLEQDEDLLKNRFIAAIGHATAGELANGVVYTYKSQFNTRDPAGIRIPQMQFRKLNRRASKAEKARKKAAKLAGGAQ